MAAGTAPAEPGVGRPDRAPGGRGLLILGPLGADNPLWVSEPVGETPVFNLLLWVYGVPAVLFGLAAAELRKRESRGWRRPWRS